MRAALDDNRVCVHGKRHPLLVGANWCVACYAFAACQWNHRGRPCLCSTEESSG